MENGLLNVSPATSLWTLGLVALGAACEAVDHTVGSATNDDLLSAAGGGGDAAGGRVSGVWDDLPIPDSCTRLQSEQFEGQCDLEVECAGAPVFVRCSGSDGVLECRCLNGLPEVGFVLTGVSLSRACAHTLAACLNWPELDAGPLECVSTGESDDLDFCISSGNCSREGVIGDANFTEAYVRTSNCSWGPSSWTCDCFGPITASFELATATSDPPCLDASDWCVGVGVESIGSRTCALTSASESESSCHIDVECEQAVTLSGQEATMYQDESVDCLLAGNGSYQCSCAHDDWAMEVAAEDLASACAATVSLCVTG